MLDLMSNLAEIIAYIFTSWIAMSLIITTLGGVWMIYKDYRYSQRLKKNSRHRIQKDEARFVKELEAYDHSVDVNGNDTEFFTQVADMIEGDYRFQGSQDLGQIYYPNYEFGTGHVDAYFEDPEMLVSHPNDKFFGFEFPENSETWSPSAYKPQYTQAELDRMFHEEYTEVYNSSPENRVIQPALDVYSLDCTNAFKAAMEEVGFHEKLEELLDEPESPAQEEQPDSSE